jgi:hypothetical protein
VKKTVLAIIAVAVLAASSFAREGAQLLLINKDGQVISGELLAVKHHSLIMKDASGVGLTQDIDNLAVISVRRGSHLLAGLGIGLAVGTAMGAGIGYASGQDYDPKRGIANISLLFTSRQTTALVGGVLGALAGAAAGAVIGSSTRSSKTIKLADLSPEQVEKAIVWLRSKARFPEESD